jgi:glycosidase
MASAFLQFALPGNPCIYYGDEIGMQGYEDPLNRAFFKWSDTDCELRCFYKELSLLKNKEKALALGSVEFIKSDGRHLVFERKWEDEIIIAELSLDGEGEEKRESIFSYKKENIFVSFYKRKA